MENNSSKWGLIKKALYIWIVQYHGIIPREILQGYIHKYKHESENIAKYGKRFFDPNNIKDYNKWLSFKEENKQTEIRDDITFIGHNITGLDDKVNVVEMDVLDLQKINTPYVCVTTSDIIFYPCFHESLNHIQGDIVYFDHDHNENGQRSNPVCKPDFSYDTLRGFNYIGDVIATKKEVLQKYDGEPINVYKWLLELSDTNINIQHISNIAYGVQNEDTFDVNTLEQYFKDTNQNVDIQNLGNCAYVRYQVQGEPLISIVIPTKDNKDVLKVCVDSIFNKTSYKSYEICIIDNNSEKQETFDYLKALQKEHENVQVVRMEVPFNFSLINNRMVFEHAKGEYVVLLNNDTEVMQEDWLTKMLSYAQLKHVGSVGVKLYYDDGTIQHGGIISGKGGGFAHRYYRKEDSAEGYLHTLKIPNDVFGCTAACLMLSKEKYQEVGGMNEEMAVQFNDVELCLKLLQKGYYNVFLPDVTLYHYESKSRGIDKKQDAVDRYMSEVEFVQQHFAEYIEHDPYYNDAFDKNYDYMLQSGTGSN